MTQHNRDDARKPGASGEQERGARESSDAKARAQAAGGTVYEHEAPTRSAEPGAREERRDANDAAHGYSQDSGYMSSGGYKPEAPGAQDGSVEPESYVAHGRGQTDEQIRADVHERLASQRARSVGQLSIAVGDGIVTLQGTVQNESDERQLVDLVRSIPSVLGVDSKLRVRASAS